MQNIINNTSPFTQRTLSKDTRRRPSTHSSQGYYSIRNNSAKGAASPSRKSIITLLYPKEQKVSLDYFLGTAKMKRASRRDVHREKLAKVGKALEKGLNGEEIVKNLKVIFFEHS